MNGMKIIRPRTFHRAQIPTTGRLLQDRWAITEAFQYWAVMRTGSSPVARQSSRAMARKEQFDDADCAVHGHSLTDESQKQ
jgi:hypothetical protein